jgi:hypothetical protein
MWVWNPMIPAESRACPFIIADQPCPGAKSLICLPVTVSYWPPVT